MPSNPQSTQQKILDRLRSAEDLLADLEICTVAVADLPAITHAVRRVQNRCTGATIAIAKQARVSGDDPNATLLGRGGVSGSTARKETERAETTEAMPDLGKAASTGDISAEHLDAISRARKGLNEAERAAFDELAPELAEAAAKLPVDTFKRKLRKLVDDARQDHGLTRLQKQRARSGIKMWTDAEGMGHTHIVSDPERHDQLRSALERQMASLAAAAKNDGEAVTKGAGLLLDALIDLIARAQGGLGRPTITIIVDDETLVNGPHDGTVCETEAGVDLPITVVERHLCDSVTQTVTLDRNGLPLDVGRRSRTATPAQWAALNALYRSCAWHGCDRPITWCQAHHIKEWEHGGSTDLDNLIPLCSKHHHSVHDDGWQLTLDADRSLHIHRPASSSSAGGSQGTKPHRHATKRGSPPSRTETWATTHPDRFTNLRAS